MMKKILNYWCKFLLAHPKEFVFLTLVLFSYGISNAQIVINEVKQTGSVELKNLGATTVDVSTYWLCDFPAYTRLDNASITVETGSLLLTAGAIVEVSGFDFIDSADGELGLYSSSAFSSSAAIVDYIEWGSTGHQRSSVAVAAGTWTAGDFIPAFDNSLSIQFDGAGDTAADYGAYVSTLGAENGTCPQLPDGGMVTLADGVSTSYANCAGDIVFDVAHTTTATNISYWYIITDDNDNILAWQNAANGNTLDLSGAPAGECHVWGWSYSGLPNPIVGQNISTLADDDCEEISDNWITVYREVPDGGTVTLADGTSTSYANCAGDIVFDMAHTTTAPNLSYWYIITDDNDNILAWQNAANGNTLDLSAAPAGECHVWGWNYRGLPDPIVGNHISTLADDACEDISDNWVTVYREIPDGGTVTLADGTSTSYANCAGDIIFDMAHTTTAPNLSYWYIITDDNDNILAWQNAANGNTLDLSAAPAGECHVWGWNYRGLPDPIVGNHISTLSDDACEDISDNWVTVYREIPDGGTVTLADGTSTSYANCAGDIVFDMAHITTAPNLSYWYIITDDNDNILAWQNSANGNTLDLSAAPAGECHVWGWNYRGLPDPIVGNHISTLADDACEDISDNWVTVYREVPDGGTVTLADGTSTSYANCAGDIVFDMAHTTTAPNLSYWYIITDDNDNILAWQNSANGNTLDLSAAPAGECHVWGWNYRGLPDPIVGNHISTLSDDACEDISDNWVTVYREIPDGGTVTLADGTSTSYANCAGNIVFDMAHTTTAPNLSYWYIITDDNDNILAWQNAANGNTLDLSAAPAGECHVWGWNYRGLPDPVVGNHISTLSDDACEDISDNWVTVYREVPDGGTVTLADGTSTSYANCAGDIVFDMAHTTTAPNLSYWYIITDDNDNILAWQNAANGNTLDLSAAPAGECHVWGWNYRGLPDPIVGNHISTLSDDACEDISDNWVTVYREIPDGGTVTLADGTSTSYANCAGDIVFDMAHTTTAPNLSYWYIITDDNDNILAWQNAANGNTLDLSAAPAGECHVWGWNYRGLPDPIVGNHISTLSDDACEDISDNWVTVYREIPDGGTVTLADGTSTSYANCAGNIVFDMAHTTTAPNLSYWYIITDDNDNILAWQNAANGNTLDLSAAPAGECHVWGWNYRGLPDPIVGNHISTLSDDACEDISDNWVTVYREVPDGGMVTLADGVTTSYTGQAGNIVFDVAHTTTAPNLSYWYIITDDNDNILAWQNAANGNTLDLSGAPAGECHVWGWNYRGLPDPIVGDHISTLADDACEDISDNWIIVTREDPLSVEDFANSINFRAYPNPTTSVLNLQSSANQSFEITIELYDISGRRVYQEENTLHSTIRINVASLQSGVYLLNITDKESNSKITRRVIKQ
jgi:hypothetical protein